MRHLAAMGTGREAGRLTPIEQIVASVRSYVPTTSERAYWEELVRALVARRKALGMSQQELGHRLGVTEHLVAKWECFARLPGPFMMMCWASTLRCKLVVRRDET